MNRPSETTAPASEGLRVKLPARNIFGNKFSNKIIAVSIILLFCVSSAFTYFFYHNQSRTLTDILVQNNLLLADILAHNTRLGVFSENEELLRTPVEALLQQREIEEISVFNEKGLLLLQRKRGGAGREPGEDGETGIDGEALNRLQSSVAPLYLVEKGKFKFWAPVTGGKGLQTAESLLMGGEMASPGEQKIGYVQITVGQSFITARLDQLLWKSLLIALLFLVTGSGVLFIIMKRITNPLDALTKGVQNLGQGALGAQVPVQTEDEIGKLALAFNQMSESLLKREKEKELLEEQFRHSQRMETIGTLAGGVAHDFNNILGIIIGYVELMSMTAPDKNQMRGYLQEIYQASMRARDLVKQILAFCRRDIQEQQPLLIMPVVEEVLKMMRASLPATIEIRSRLDKGLGFVQADPTQIHQVLMNLCTNAGQAMQGSSGILDVTLEEMDLGAAEGELPPGRYQVLTVGDTGCGMDAAIRQRIFDPFFTTKGPGKGTGLGLSVVHGIVKSHGGRVECRSEPGKGSTFRVFLPVIEEESSVLVREAEAVPRGRERVLFVDDELTLVDIGRQMLQNLGYTVVAETSSIEALDTFRAHPEQFDLLITDNSMPRMTGLEMVAKIKRLRPGLPVILCTGFSDGLSEDVVRAHGIAGLVMKPLTWENTARLIRQVLDC